jgi:hypothetical protein
VSTSLRTSPAGSGLLLAEGETGRRNVRAARDEGAQWRGQHDPAARPHVLLIQTRLGCQAEENAQASGEEERES